MNITRTQFETIKTNNRGCFKTLKVIDSYIGIINF